MKSHRGVSLTVAGDSEGPPPEKQGAMDQDDRDGLRAGGSENSGVATGHTKKLTNANIGEEGGFGDGAFTYVGIKYRFQSPREGDEEGRYDATPLGRGEGRRGDRNKGTVLEGQTMFKHRQASRDDSLNKQPDPTLGYGLKRKGDGEYPYNAGGSGGEWPRHKWPASHKMATPATGGYDNQHDTGDLQGNRSMVDTGDAEAGDQGVYKPTLALRLHFHEPQGIVQGEYAHDTEPRRLVIATMSLRGQVVRHVASFDSLGRDCHASGPPDAGAEVEAKDVIWINSWGRPDEEAPRLFKGLQEQGVTEWWGWTSYEHMVKDPGLRERVERTLDKTAEDYENDSFITPTAIHRAPKLARYSIDSFLRRYKDFGEKLKRHHDKVTRLKPGSSMREENRPLRWAYVAAFTNMGMTIQRGLDDLQLCVWQLGWELSKAKEEARVEEGTV